MKNKDFPLAEGKEGKKKQEKKEKKRKIHPDVLLTI